MTRLGALILGLLLALLAGGLLLVTVGRPTAAGEAPRDRPVEESREASRPQWAAAVPDGPRVEVAPAPPTRASERPELALRSLGPLTPEGVARVRESLSLDLGRHSLDEAAAKCERSDDIAGYREYVAQLFYQAKTEAAARLLEEGDYVTVPHVTMLPHLPDGCAVFGVQAHVFLEAKRVDVWFLIDTLASRQSGVRKRHCIGWTRTSRAQRRIGSTRCRTRFDCRRCGITWQRCVRSRRRVATEIPRCCGRRGRRCCPARFASIETPATRRRGTRRCTEREAHVHRAAHAGQESLVSRAGLGFTRGVSAPAR